ncbi:MAG: IS1182 family transposase [Xenococcus sp. (in: cyanobacteria)]
MCLHPELIPPVPEATARVAKAAFPKGNRYMRLRDELGIFYNDEEFAELYPDRGQSAIAPWRLTMILIMQFLENLSDRQTADAVRGRIDWKYALSLELEDDGFDFSVLSEFRDRVIKQEAETQILEQMLQRFQEKGLLKARGKQRTDSTHVLAKVRELTRLENLIETLRSALNTLAEVAPEWLGANIQSEWCDRYGKRVENTRLPSKKDERNALAVTVGRDGFDLLDAIYASTAPMELRWFRAVEILRQVWLQQYYAPTPEIQLRSEKDGPPSAIRIRSPYETEARNSTKRSTNWTGYKVHLSETCSENLPHLITSVETTPATTQDQQVVTSIHQSLAKQNLLPTQHLVDQGYTSARLMTESERDYQIDLFGPVGKNGGWQARAGLGFDLSHFQIDWNPRKVYCPEGKQSRSWKKGKDNYGKPIIHVEFRQNECKECPVRSLCTRAPVHARGITLLPQLDYETLQKARERQQTEEFEKQYALRSGIEGTLSQGIRGFGLRQCRYRGLAKTHLQHILTAAAINLERIYAWLEGIPLAQTRQSHFEQMAHRHLAIA